MRVIGIDEGCGGISLAVLTCPVGRIKRTCVFIHPITKENRTDHITPAR